MALTAFTYSFGLIIGNVLAAPVNALLGIKGVFIATMVNEIIEALLLGAFYTKIVDEAA